MYHIVMSIKCLVIFVSLCAFVAHGQKPSRLDSVDIDAVLNNKRLLKNYIDCLASARPCTPEGAELKRVLPDALRTECANCSAKQRENTRKIVRYFINDNTEHWEKLSKIYDPTGEYTRHYCELAKREGIPAGQRCLAY